MESAEIPCCEAVAPRVRVMVPLELMRMESGCEAERAQDTHGEAVAASGGDGELDAARVGGVEGGEVARADAAIVAEQRAVQVDGDEADGVVVMLLPASGPRIRV